MCIHKSNILHIWLGCVPSLHGCGWPFYLGLCFLNLLNCFHHCLFQPLFFFPVSNTLCFFWLSILEHLFFNYFTSYGNINIHHIHIRNDCFCLSDKLNFCYCHKFLMKHFLHLSKLWTICHFMSIQTIDATCIWKCLLCFLTWLWCLCGYHRGLLFLTFANLHIMICDPTICAMFVSFPCITLCFCWCCLFGTLWYW